MKIKSLIIGKGPVQGAVEDAEALERAASMARQENDYEHADMLEKAALYKRRVAGSLRQSGRPEAECENVRMEA